MCETTLLEEEIIKKITNRISFSDFNVNIINEDKKTLLHLACQLGMEKLTDLLLEKGAEINKKDCFGRTPIMLACFAGHQNIVDMLITRNADIISSDSYGYKALTLAAYGGCYLVKYLFNENKTLSIHDFDSKTIPLLAVASSIGNEELVDFIITEVPEQINSTIEKTGITPLMIAICGGHVKVAKRLIKNGALTNVKSNASLSAFSYARKLSFPLLELKIPQINLDNQDNSLNPNKLQKHPLTPNLYLSPVKNIPSPKKCFRWIKKTIRVKRSKSLDSKKQNINQNEDKDDNTFKSIFHISKLEQYWPLFKEQQISFRTFLTMDEEDLRSVGIAKVSVLNKFLTLIDHYNHIFYL